jgi:putative transcription factor
VIKINCDLCGKIEYNLKRALIEEVELNVCPSCSKFGKVLGPVKKDVIKQPAKDIEFKEVKIELIVEDYSDIIKKRRESMRLTQKDFANKLNEKESTIHKIETGTLEPSLALAKKLEKILNIKLIEEHEEKHVIYKRKKIEGFTLGDFIKIK